MSARPGAGALGEVALITGGGAGIGRATALLLADHGVKRIYLSYATAKEAALRTIDELRERGAEAIALRCDIGAQDEVETLIERIASENDGLDHLVNNAGTTELIPFTELQSVTRDVWERLWRTNVLGTFEVARSAERLLRAARGSIVNVSSIAAHRASGSSLPYGVTKAAVVQMTRALAVSLAPEVRVNSVSPGTVRTGWHTRMIDRATFEAKADSEAEGVPLGRIAEAEDVAAAIVGLLAMPFVTGEDMRVDGGKGLRY